ncbi:MAG TPA: hypothetical protein VG095_00830 [Chthoniobacterales bacterium]|nr:hypothetical protein [Chthoniobacterales bacterium]
MKTKLLTLLVAASMGVAAYGAIDFSPVPTERVLEGWKFAGLKFHENGRAISYEHPRGWSYSGGGARIRFTPPNLTQAVAEIDQAPVQGKLELTEETAKLLQQKALASVPPDSQKVTLVSEAVNPFQVNTHSTYEAVVAYEAFGQEFMLGIVYVNLPDTQLRFRSVALKADFEKVHGPFRSSIFSLEWEKTPAPAAKN